MVTAILRNSLYAETLISSRSKSQINSNPNHMRSRRRKRSTTQNNQNCWSKSHNQTVDPRSAAKKLVMGQVKILKRGEDLCGVKLGLADDDLALSSTDRLGPDPVVVQKQVRVFNNLYAGSPSALASPPPSSLPFPAFFAKKEKPNDVATVGPI